MMNGLSTKRHQTRLQFWTEIVIKNLWCLFLSGEFFLKIGVFFHHRGTENTEELRAQRLGLLQYQTLFCLISLGWFSSSKRITIFCSQRRLWLLEESINRDRKFTGSQVNYFIIGCSSGLHNGLTHGRVRMNGLNQFMPRGFQSLDRNQFGHQFSDIVPN